MWAVLAARTFPDQHNHCLSVLSEHHIVSQQLLLFVTGHISELWWNAATNSVSAWACKSCLQNYKATFKAIGSETISKRLFCRSHFRFSKGSVIFKIDGDSTEKERPQLPNDTKLPSATSKCCIKKSLFCSCQDSNNIHSREEKFYKPPSSISISCFLHLYLYLFLSFSIFQILSQKNCSAAKKKLFKFSTIVFSQWTESVYWAQLSMLPCFVSLFK